jgi:hypothetical protein
MTMVRDDGGIVDAELIRPWAWIRSHRIGAGKPLPMNIPELPVTGVAMVTYIGECPTISEGEGSVITARFLTRQVEVIARVEILSADGTIEVLEGTTVHPIWSLDRNDWVPLDELQSNEQLAGQTGPATVLQTNFVNRQTAVYNIEVHAEHVFEVGTHSVLVHNACPDLPPRLGGGPTSGLLNGLTPLVSGGPAPGVFSNLVGLSDDAIIALKHVEAHAVANMITNNLDEASLFINYASGPCRFCRSGIPELMQNGQKLWVVFEQGVGFFTRTGWTRVL